MKSNHSNTFVAAFLAPVVIWSGASDVHAAALTWDTTIAADGTITAGDGTWQNGSGNWNNGTTSVGINWNNTAPDSATFAGADGTYAITIGGAITSGGITFSNSGYTLGAASAQTITLAASTNIAVASGKSATIGSNVTVTRAGSYSITSGGTLNVTGTGARVQTTGGGNLSVAGGSKVFVGTGGTFASQGSMVIGSDTASNTSLEVDGGDVNITTTSGANLVLANGTSGSASVTLTSGSITNSLIGGTLRFGTSSANTASSTFHLNGGVLTIGRVWEGNTGHASTFNFNGGTLRALATSTNLATFMTGIDTANVRNGGASIDSNGATVTLGQNLVHSIIGGDNAIDGGLTKLGTGTLIVTGTNTYTGATAINQGTLSAGNIVVSGGSSHLGNAATAVTLGSAGSQGTLSYTGGTATYTRGFTIGGAGGGRLDVTDSAANLTINTGAITGTGLFTIGGAGLKTIDSAITHTGGLTKASGSGSIYLTNGSNNYTGVTDISGALIVTANNALGSTAGGTTVNASSSLGFSGGIDYTATETVSGSGAGSAAITGVIPAASRGFIQSVSGNNTFRGNIIINAGGTSRIGTQDGASLTLTGSITQASGDILFRTGSTAGDFVTLSNAGNSFGGDSTIFTGATAGNHAGVRLGATNALPTNLTVSGLSGTGAGTALDLNGFNQSLNGLIGAATLNIINSNTSTASTLTLDPTVDKATTGTLIRGGGGLGTINVIKAGSFAQTLSGTHDYTGTTTVSNGTLVIDGNISTSSLTTVSSGATISGSGGTVGALTIASGGFIAPGNSPGILSVSGNYTQPGTYIAEINGLVAGTGHDRIDVTGTVDITGGSLSTIFTGTYAVNDMIFILLNDGTDAITGTFSGLAQGSVVTTYGGFDWQISYLGDSVGNTFTGGNDIVLMAVPEPGAALLGGLGVLVLLRRRRS